MAKQADRGLGGEPSLDFLEGQCRHAERELGLRHARLHAKDFHQHMPVPEFRIRYLVKAHVAKPVELPCLHRSYTSKLPSARRREANAVYQAIGEKWRSLPRSPLWSVALFARHENRNSVWRWPEWPDSGEPRADGSSECQGRSGPATAMRMTPPWRTEVTQRTGPPEFGGNERLPGNQSVSVNPVLRNVCDSPPGRFRVTNSPAKNRETPNRSSSLGEAW